MSIGGIYFYTATINGWYNLFTSNQFNKVIIQSLEYLSSQRLMDIFSFVIMPTHVHFIWRSKQLNGKESAQGSFLKYTAHQLLRLLRTTDPMKLNRFRVDAANKKHEFWQRDPMAVRLFTQDVAIQNLNYIHRNPCRKKWKLCDRPENYEYSSASFYKTGVLKYPFLKDLRLEKFF
jgi:putative transposase